MYEEFFLTVHLVVDEEWLNVEGWQFELTLTQYCDDALDT
jgi:hypothetical protein